MNHDPSTRPRPLKLVARVLAVGFAVALSSFLIVREHRRARPEPARAPTFDAREGSAEGAAMPSAPILSPRDGRPDGDADVDRMGTKSAVLAPAELPATYLSTSKSLSILAPTDPEPPPVAAAGEDRYLPSSKAGSVTFIYSSPTSGSSTLPSPPKVVGELPEPPPAAQPAPAEGSGDAEAPRSKP